MSHFFDLFAESQGIIAYLFEQTSLSIKCILILKIESRLIPSLSFVKNEPRLSIFWGSAGPQPLKILLSLAVAEFS